MSAEEMLRENERSAINSGNNGEDQFISRVGEKAKSSKFGKKKSLGALGLITLMILILVVLVSSGNLIPAAISERLVEATDVQYADAVESKMLVFQQAMENNSIPENTKKRLEAQGIKVEGGSLVFKGETITAGNFINKMHENAGFYKAFNAATYDRAAYYYDNSAEEVFKKIGTSRNNYSSSSEFEEVMSRLVGSGSNINVSNVGLVEKEDEYGNKYTTYDVIGENASSSSAEEFVRTVTENNLDEDGLSATMDATVALNTADTIMKEQKSSIFFLAFMENISKMKAGQGNSSKINEAMNYLFRETESFVMDVKTGEMITTKASMLEAPSLYAILAGEKIKTEKVTNYASDRVLKTVENRVGTESTGDRAKQETVTSTGTKNRGTIGRFLFSGEAAADYGTTSAVTPIINSSMVENDFESIGGIYGGELLVEGAVNVGKMLAKASGATAGDGEAAKSYARLNSAILALDAEADRESRSPFDITSKNTFLGSIVHSLAVSVGKNPLITAISKILPSASAKDEGTEYLTNFGDCETLGSVGAVGSAGCTEVATFDTSTLKDTFNNGEFNAFVEENTTLEDGKRTVKKDSDLADFIKYNNERLTPTGVMDGGILEALKGNSSSIPFISNIIAMIKTWLGATDEEKDMARGKVFVNSSSNDKWDKYKYAQRYVSLARATDALRQYDGDETAYTNIKYFEGNENPVIAFLHDYYAELAVRP